MTFKTSFIAATMAALAQAALAAPATLVQSVTHDGETITMRLTREDLRGAQFELWSQNASGGYDIVTPVDERSYIGSVDGYPGAVSCGVQLDSGQFKGAVYFDRGATWFTLGTSVVSTRALDYVNFTNYQFPAAPTVASGQGGSTMYGFDLGVDADHDYYSNAGNSVATAFEGIEYSVCLVRAIYMRDALLRPYLGRVIIRSASAYDPYTGLTQGDYLSALRNEWNTNHTDADRDAVSGTSPNKIGGGLAWVGVIGSSSAYSVNQANSSGNFDVVFRHELGHNWNCGHFVGGSPEGTGLMGGNAAGRFSGCETYRVLNHRSDKVGILDNEGSYSAVELPPYASLDAAEVLQPATGPVTIDVLANDHDANGQTLSLASFDSITAEGGTVTQQGQDLLYTAPGMLVGSDSFTYSISDTAGRTATGAVVISVTPDDPLRLYLALDEGTGTTAADLSVFDNPGSVSGTDFTTSSGPGAFGNAITLDGTDDHITASGMQLNSNTVTITAWIKAGATQNPWAGIVFDRSGNAAGLNIGTGSELRYHWNDNNWSWNSGLTPPADTWTFVALVVEPTSATIYMNSGSGFQSAINTTTHAAESFGTTYIGRDPNSDARSFTGTIDEVRIYNQSMSQAELQTVYDGGAASAPKPFDGATEVTSKLLSWAPGASATGYNVYLGTSQAAVAAATMASPEFQETTTSPFHLATLADQSNYFWRIDTVTASTTLTGSVWTFMTAILPVPGNSILVNFDRGGSEAFAGGELIGPTATDSSNWISATGADGSLTALTDGAGAATSVDVLWYSSTTWGNSDGTGDDEHRLAVGYLDDGDGSNGDGKGVVVTFNNIPYANYKVYGLYATDQNSSGSAGIVNFDVNGTWALGGSASTTASAWGSIEANNAANGSYWTEIDPGVVQGNYWVVDTSGSTCTITGELRDGSNRGCLTGVIIENIDLNNPPTWDSNPVNEADAIEGVAYASTLLDNASDADTHPLTFAYVSGPPWLTVSANGDLGGVPGSGNTGPDTWTVSVSDGIAPPVEVALNITVLSDNDGDGDPDTSDPDDDNDGIPDTWETAHSLDPLSDDSAGDPDADGYDNGSEYVADTHPQDGTSSPTCAIDVDQGAAEHTIRFDTSLNRNYAVEYRDDLVTGSWQDLQPAAPGTGSEMSVTDNSGITRRFYRLRIELP